MHSSNAEVQLDSLDVSLSEYSTPQEKIDYLDSKAKDFMYSDTSASLVYWRKAIGIGIKYKLYKELGTSYKNIGNLYFNINDSKNTKKNYTQAYEYFVLSNDSLGIAKMNNNMGIYYARWEKNYVKSLSFLERSLEVKKAMGVDGILLSRTYFNISESYLELGSYVKSLRNLFKGLEQIEEEEYPLKYAEAYNIIANVYFRMEDYDMAEKYLSLSRVINEREGSDIQLADNNILSGKIYIIDEDYDKALVELKSAEEKFAVSHRTLDLGMVYSQYMLVYLDRSKYKEVFEYSKLAEKIFIRYDDQYNLSKVYSILGETYFKKNRTALSILYFRRSNRISVANKYLEVSFNNFNFLGEIHHGRKEYKRAYSSFIRSSNLRDSIFSVSKTRIVSEAEDRFLNAKKDLELGYVSEQKSMVERDRDASYKEANYLKILVALALVILVLIFYLYYSNKKLNDELEDLVQERTKDLKKSNELLINSKKNEEDTSRVKSVLLKNISELLKSPILEINNLIQILKSENEDNDEVYTQLELISNRSFRLSSILDSITNLYNIEGGKEKRVEGEFDLKELVKGVVDLYKDKAESRGLKLLLGEMTSLSILHDMNLVHNSIDHLLKTVVDYANKGDVVLSIFEKEGRSIVEVDSSNFNINKNIFNGDLTTKSEAKYDIDKMFVNLYIVKKMISKQGGDVLWESTNNGEGIKFTLSFISQ